MKPPCCDWWYCHIGVRPFLGCFAISDMTIANVNGWCYCHCGWCYCHYCFLLYCGRCNNHLLLADVFAKCVMADVVAICGRWNSHFIYVFSLYHPSTLLNQPLLCKVDIGKTAALPGETEATVKWVPQTAPLFSFSHASMIACGTQVNFCLRCQSGHHTYGMAKCLRQVQLTCPNISSNLLHYGGLYPY